MMAKQTNCRNCDAPLAGEFCSQCGQREGRGDLTFASLAGEFVEEIFDWDSRIWRTLLPLLFRPGFLTAEYIAGHRARYVPPFRLYLIVSFLLFLVVSLLAGGADFIHVYPGDNKGVDVIVDKAAPGTGVGEALSVAKGVESPDSDDTGPADIGADGDIPPWLEDIIRRLEHNAGKVSDDPGGFVQQLVEYLPQMMFLLLPVFALLLKCCYLFTPFHYLQHLVFSLHYHSFGYLLYLVGTLLSVFSLENVIGGVLALAFVSYLPIALMRVYGSGLWGALGKTVAILAVDAILLVFAVAGMLLFTLANM